MADALFEDLVLDHLVIPESILALRKTKVNIEILDDNDGLRAALQFALDYLDKHGEPPSEAVISAETGYSDFQVPEAPIEYVIDKFRSKHARRELNRTIKKMARSADDPQAALRIGFDEIARIKWESSDSQPLDTDRLSLALDRYATRQAQGPGFTFGFDQVDRVLGGMRQGEIYFGVGRLKAGKSWLFGVKPAVEGLRSGMSSLIFSLELSEAEMHDRVTCMLANVSYAKFRDLNLSEKEKSLILRAEEWCQSQDARVYIKQPLMGERTAPALIQEARQYNIDAVFIDQLSYIEPHTNLTEPQWLRIKETCQYLKNATAHWPIMVLAQLNREAEGLGEMADATKVGLSDSIPQIADMLLGVYSSKDMRQQNMLEYGVIEARAYGGFPRWHVKNEVGICSDYRVLNRL